MNYFKPVYYYYYYYYIYKQNNKDSDPTFKNF